MNQKDFRIKKMIHDQIFYYENLIEESKMQILGLRNTLSQIERVKSFYNLPPFPENSNWASIVGYITEFCFKYQDSPLSVEDMAKAISFEGSISSRDGLVVLKRRLSSAMTFLQKKGVIVKFRCIKNKKKVIYVNSKWLTSKNKPKREFIQYWKDYKNYTDK